MRLAITFVLSVPDSKTTNLISTISENEKFASHYVTIQKSQRINFLKVVQDSLSAKTVSVYVAGGHAMDGWTVQMEAMK